MATGCKTAYYKHFQNSCLHFDRVLVKKLKSSNTIKLEGDNLYRTLLIPDTGKEIFNYQLGKYLTENGEMINEGGKDSSPEYAFRLLTDVVKLVGSDALVRKHLKGDMAIISPLVKLNENFRYSSSEGEHQFDRGHIAIPVKTVEMFEGKMLCFMPASDEEDWWVKDVLLIDLNLNVSPEPFKKTYADKKVLFNNGEFGGYIPSELKELLSIKDSLFLSGKWYQIVGFGDDGVKHGYPIYEMIIGYEYVQLSESIVRKCHSKSIGYAKRPQLKGMTAYIPTSVISVYRHVTFQLVKIDKDDNFGVLEVRMENSIFNKYGYLASGCY